MSVSSAWCLNMKLCNADQDKCKYLKTGKLWSLKIDSSWLLCICRTTCLYWRRRKILNNNKNDATRTEVKKTENNQKWIKFVIIIAYFIIDCSRKHIRLNVDWFELYCLFFFSKRKEKQRKWLEFNIFIMIFFVYNI